LLQIVPDNTLLTAGNAWFTEVNVPNAVISFVTPAIEALPGLAEVLKMLPEPGAFIPRTCIPLMVKTSSLFVLFAVIVIVTVVDVTDTEAAVIFCPDVKDGFRRPGWNSKFVGAVKIKVVFD
jgi:hypothetical protein